MRFGGGHFSRLGIVPRALATVAVWAIAVVMEERLHARLTGLALGALALCLTLMIWITKGDEGS